MVTASLNNQIRPQVQAPAGAVNLAYIPLSAPLQPGRNEITITDFPPGTRVISAWATELSGDHVTPWAGNAWLYTLSVELAADSPGSSVRCRMAVNCDWSNPVASAIHLVYG